MREMRRNWFADDEAFELGKKPFFGHGTLPQPAGLAGGLEVGRSSIHLRPSGFGGHVHLPSFGTLAQSTCRGLGEMRPGGCCRLVGSPARPLMGGLGVSAADRSAERAVFEQVLSVFLGLSQIAYLERPMAAAIVSVSFCWEHGLVSTAKAPTRNAFERT